MLAIRRAEHSSDGLGLFSNLPRVVKAPRASNQAFQFVTVGDDHEHFVDEVMGEYAMGLIQCAPFSPLE